MSDERNLDKVSVKDLEKEKLQAEINILKARLDKEYPDEKPEGRMNRVAEFARKWSAFILGVLTLIGAGWGVFIPLQEFLVEQRKALEYNLNDQMIKFVDALDDSIPAVANKSVMMLSYYETNSIPILLFYLENLDEDKIDLKIKIIETVNLIYAENQNIKIVKKIRVGIVNTFNQLWAGDPGEKQALYNYFDLITEMQLKGRHKKIIRNQLIDIKDIICSNKKNSEELGLDNIRDRICEYVDEDPCNCN